MSFPANETVTVDVPLPNAVIKPSSDTLTTLSLLEEYFGLPAPSGVKSAKTANSSFTFKSSVSLARVISVDNLFTVIVDCLVIGL